MPASPGAARAITEAARAYAPLSDTQARTLAAAFDERTVPARGPVALPGAETHDVLFVVDGLLRFYYPGTDGRESNKAFVGDGAFAGAVVGAPGVPVAYGIEALEPTRYLALPYAAFSALMETDPAFERLGRRLAEHLLARKEQRMRSLLLHSAAERYAAFEAAHADLMQRVPLYHVASYLGVTDVYLSRLRRAAAASA